MKIAVVLHGHIRTWEFCKENIVTAISKIYEDFDVDWMIGVWNTNTQQNIYDYLKSKNQNVIVMDMFDTQTHLYNQRKESYGYSFPSHLGRWYIRQKLGIKRRQIEIKNNIKYEVIVYIRPDVCFLPHNENSYSAYNRFYKMIRDNDIFRSMYQLQSAGDYTDFWNHGQQIREIGMDDMFTVAGSLAADLFDKCYLEYNDATPTLESYKLGFGDTHLPTATYFMQHSITSSFTADTLRGKLCPIVIRPHVTIENFKNIIIDNSIQLKYVNEWKTLSIDEKRDWCVKSNIDFVEYDVI